MAIPPPIQVFGLPDGSGLWHPTTLDVVGKDERFLEDAIFANPELLGLGSVRNGIRPPYRVFRQVALNTPTGRVIIADLVALFASGHVLIVEVKRWINPELRDRQVIAQLLDYATSIQTLTVQNIESAFVGGGVTPLGWSELVASWFPGVADPDELADLFLRRLWDGEIHLVLACDRLPAGLLQLASALSRQATLGFELDVVELVPYANGSLRDSLILVPHRRLGTEIVARTAITIKYQGTEGRPTTTVNTTSLDEIEESVRDVQSGQTKRQWGAAEIASEIQAQSCPAMSHLWRFALDHSFNNQVVAQGRKVNPNFGFFLPMHQVDGTFRPRMAWTCNPLHEPPSIYFFMQFIEAVIGAQAFRNWHSRLRELLGPTIKAGAAEQNVAIAVIEPKLEAFCNLVLDLKTTAVSKAPSL